MLEKIKKYISKNIFPVFWGSLLMIVAASAALPRILDYSESPAFCGVCHSMKQQSQTWEHSRHRGVKCIDCHLPNDNLPEHFFWKGIDGTKDVISQTLGLKEEDEIRLSEHGKKVLQSNCVRCHKDIVSHIDNKRSCVDCHRGIHHRYTAAACSFNTEVNNAHK